jgi:hypothetical protein
MADGYIYRAGDIVHHEPTGEDWVVAYLDGEHIAWCGWPAGEAMARDCWLKKSSTDEEHRSWLEQIAKSDGKRARMAQRELERMVVDVGQVVKTEGLT